MDIMKLRNCFKIQMGKAVIVNVCEGNRNGYDQWEVQQEIMLRTARREEIKTVEPQTSLNENTEIQGR